MKSARKKRKIRFFNEPEYETSTLAHEIECSTKSVEGKKSKKR